MKTSFIPLSDPDITPVELEAVAQALQTPQLSAGPQVEAFEEAFARYLGRRYAVATATGGLAMLLALAALGIAAGDEVIAPAYSWREAAHAVVHLGARPVFADIDYYSGTLAPEKAAARIGPKTKAILAGNTNGHPAPWRELRALAAEHQLCLIEDSTEAIGSRYLGRPVGSFGDCSVFDFSQPGPLVCGEGGMVVTDDPDVAAALRRHRGRKPGERSSVVIGLTAPRQAQMSELSAALGLAQLERLDVILEKRKAVERCYHRYVRSFEGIKDPYAAPEVDEAHWFLYQVHLGTRFTRSARDQILDDLRTENIDSHAYACPLHEQPLYREAGWRRGDLLVTEKVADRVIALPFHTHLTEAQIAFVVGTMKDSSVNVGAGTPIY
jgi:dTDP-4-amino-4,6-dideoxygalactose transaminase